MYNKRSMNGYGVGWIRPIIDYNEPAMLLFLEKKSFVSQASTAHSYYLFVWRNSLMMPWSQMCWIKKKLIKIKFFSSSRFWLYKRCDKTYMVIDGGGHRNLPFRSLFIFSGKFTSSDAINPVFPGCQFFEFSHFESRFFFKFRYATLVWLLDVNL